MGEFVKGDIVVIPFPFSDLSANKRRPAIVLADFCGDDLIMAQITSKSVSDSYAVTIELNDMIDGSLSETSNIRPNKLFTADKGIVVYKICRLSPQKMNMLTKKLIEIFM